MNGVGDVLGEICKAVFPIPEECYAGDPDSPVAVCTLSSIDLLRQIASSDILGRISVAGRLLSENRGIDALVRHLNSHRKIKTLLVCGREVRGHLAGHSLLALHKNGIGADGRIIGSASPEPFLTATGQEIAYFRDVELVDRIGLVDFDSIREMVQ